MRGIVKKWIPQTRLEWALLRARLAYWSWQIASKLVMGIVYLSIIAEGFRTLVPVVSRKLHRVPMLGWMNNVEGLYQLDMAAVLALFMLIAVCGLWERLLTLWLKEEIGFDGRVRNQNNRNKFVMVLGALVLISDCVLFFVAVNEISWAGSGFSFTALCATTAYVCVLVFSIFVSVNLKEKVALYDVNNEREPTNEAGF